MIRIMSAVMALCACAHICSNLHLDRLTDNPLDARSDRNTD
jgi:hypothetical protein